MDSLVEMPIVRIRGLIFISLLFPLARCALNGTLEQNSVSSTGHDPEEFKKFLSQGSSGHKRWPAVLDRSIPKDNSFNEPRSEGIAAAQLETTIAVSSEGAVVPGDNTSVALASLTTVACNNGFMSVLIEREGLMANLSALSEDQLSFGGLHDPACRATAKASNWTHFVLATLYTHCDTKALTVDGRTVSMENQVFLQTRAPASEQLDTDGATLVVNVSCLLQDANKRNLEMDISVQTNGQGSDSLNHSFLLNVYDRQWTGLVDSHSPSTYPFRVPVGQRIFAEVQLIGSTASNSDLKAHIIDCYISRYSDPRIEFRQDIIESGCPVARSALMHHQKSLPVSRFSFELDLMYFDADYLYLHCQAVVCLKRGSREFERYQKCPSSRHCGDQHANHSSKHVFTDQPFVYLSVGPFQPFVKSTTADAGISSCPPCPLAGQMTGVSANYTQPNTSVTNIPLAYVICIAVAAFVLGMVFMGSMWYIYRRTDPRRYLIASKDCEYQDSTSCTLASAPTALALQT